MSGYLSPSTRALSDPVRIQTAPDLDLWGSDATGVMVTIAAGSYVETPTMLDREGVEWLRDTLTAILDEADERTAEAILAAIRVELDARPEAVPPEVIRAILDGETT